MVRLKLISIKALSPIKTAFQFLYGAIKTESFQTAWTSVELFQFLYGAIKTQNRPEFPIKPYPFQFLYGAIKTVCFAEKTIV